MNKWYLKTLVAAGSISLLVILEGCTFCRAGKPGPMGRYAVEIALDPSLKESSVLVDVVGVNKMEQPRWESYDMGKYWQAGDPLRRDADKIVFSYVSGQSLTNLLTSKDTHWTKWKSQGVIELLILADLPGMQESRPGNQDARRQILSLDRCNWPNGTSKIKLLVKQSGIQVETSPRTD